MTDKIKPATRADVEMARRFPSTFAEHDLIATIESWEPVMRKYVDDGCLIHFYGDKEPCDGCNSCHARKLMEQFDA